MTNRTLRWWASRTVDITTLGVLGGIASRPISSVVGIEGYGFAVCGMLLLGYWWLYVARPVFTADTHLEGLKA